ncbi:MAG: hypothetical protein M0R03_15635 [Novosphingobium sp.]|nr:hypothetical protein [Novosphingobium sp.]
MNQLSLKIRFDCLVGERLIKKYYAYKKNDKIKCFEKFFKWQSTTKIGHVGSLEVYGTEEKKNKERLTNEFYKWRLMQLQMPKVGDEIYVGSSYYIDHGEDDFDGGLCKIIKVEIENCKIHYFPNKVKK